MSRIRFHWAYVGGTFDCFHRGHIRLLELAHGVAQQVVVSLNTDEFAARYKRAPMMPLADRLAVLAHCDLADLVIVNTGNEDSRPAIVRSGADCIVHGDDWQGESLMKQMRLSEEWLTKMGIKLVTVPYTQGVSTTEILKRRANG